MRRAAFFLTFLLLAGCTSHYEQVICPNAAIVSEFSKSIDLHDAVPMRVEMDSIAPKCFAGSDKRILDFRLRMTAFRPLKDSKESHSGYVSYYVAVLENDTSKVISRSNHDLKIRFDKGQATKVIYEELTQNLPLNKEVSLYVGFNLDKNQVDYFRKERASKLKGK